MNQNFRNILYTWLLGTILLTNVVNFHFFTHLIENDEHSYVECDYCTFITQQENHHSFTVPSSYIILQHTSKYCVDKSYIQIPQTVKKTIITDYFFNKPPPAQFNI